MEIKATTNPYANHQATNAKVHYKQVDNNNLAIAALVLGIFSIAFYFITAIPGIITGHMARSRVKKEPLQYSGKGMALAGLIMSYIMLFLSVVILAGFLYAFNNIPEFKQTFLEEIQKGK